MQGKTSKGPEPFDIIMVWLHLAPGILHNFKALNESPFNDKFMTGNWGKKKNGGFALSRNFGQINLSTPKSV